MSAPLQAGKMEKISRGYRYSVIANPLVDGGFEYRVSVNGKRLNGAVNSKIGSAEAALALGEEVALSHIEVLCGQKKEGV